MRIARVFLDRCNPKKCNYACINSCPLVKNGINVIEKDETTKKIKINENLCIGCGICVKKCPFNAIKIINLPDTFKKSLVHSYGENQFRLYEFVNFGNKFRIGIIGENGLGKSTILNILSKIIIPNFGKKNVTEKDVLKFFRGKEIYNYFKKLYDGGLKISYKPQNIEIFRKKIKVIDFLGEDLIKKYKLENLKDRYLDQLSGGELQEIIIIKSLEMDRDVLILDEPSSFLDIYKRVELIKRLENEEDFIIVDHDLIIIDAVTEVTFVLYGSPGVYGIVSNALSSKEAINQYLYGYLKNENVRIRDKPIIIEGKQILEANRKIVTEWSDLIIKLNNFELEVKSGNVYEGEILGIIGRNGIGKSTFIKTLAGIIKPIKGSIKKLKISYKPQYIYAKASNIKVKDAFLQIDENKYYDEFYKNHILKQLKINEIENKFLENLSGGELQRVAIGLTLFRDAELYLLDEPTAYLDIEMRIRLQKILRDFTSTTKKPIIIVDHDLNFLDFISNRIILFKGIPSVKGYAEKPKEPYVALNEFLKELNITFRRDEITKRMRYNKLGSRKDLEQRSKEEYLEKI